MPMGWNDEGEWVSYANNCRKCGHHMPLPKCNRTHCPECGTYCHVPSEREAAEIERRAQKVCPKCGYRNSSEANFCIKCGTKVTVTAVIGGTRYVQHPTE